jgi:hypothetical protein
MVLRHALRGAVWLALLGLQAPGLAQAPEGPSGWLRFDTGLPVDPASLDSRWLALVQRPGAGSSELALRPRHSLSLRWERGSSLLIETPGVPVGSRDMALRRPQIALAEDSETLRHWLRQSGLMDARRCQAPIMKMRSTFADGSSRADISLVARCTFD